MTFHDGGSVQVEAIDTYQTAIQLLLTQRTYRIEHGQSTTELPSSSSTNNQQQQQQLVMFGNDEFFLDYRQKSLDALLSSVYSNLAKMYFMANMFDDSVEAYDEALRYKVS